MDTCNNLFFSSTREFAELNESRVNKIKRMSNKKQIIKKTKQWRGCAEQVERGGTCE